jgi:sialate O-acetylesterase
MTPALLPLLLALSASPIPGGTQDSGLRLAAPFGDHMVVQAGKPVVLWGWAPAGAQVTARMDGQEARGQADAGGRWRLELPVPAPTSDPFAAHMIEVRSGAATRTLSDVLVGEVWVASGQSNMEWPAGNCTTTEELTALGTLPGLRMFTAARISVPEVAEDVVGSWQVFAPDTVKGFSAVGTHFGLMLMETLEVPVGVVHTSWGGSKVEGWMSEPALRSTKAGTAFLERWIAQREQSAADLARYPAPTLSGEAAEGWAPCQVPVDFETLEPGFDGSIWFRRALAVPAGFSAAGATLALGAMDDIDEVWLDGVRVGGTHNHQAQRRYTLEGAAAEALADGQAQLVVRVEDTGGWGGFSGPAENIALEGPGGERVALTDDWTWKAGARGGGIPINHLPTHLSNGMVQPLVGLPVRGVIWYQGESNAGDPAGYEELFPALIRDWRARFGVLDLPFYWVQLAAFRTGADWPALREAQRHTLALPRTGMAVTIDVGNPTDIHPRDKRSVGERLARCALFDTYGREVVPAGPLPASATRSSEGVLVRFETFGARLAVRGNAALAAFELAGPDGSFQPAEARLSSEGVVVRAAAVSEPRQVRYAWRDDPADESMGANLVNDEGLPASPFRLDVE